VRPPVAAVKPNTADVRTTSPRLVYVSLFPLSSSTSIFLCVSFYELLRVFLHRFFATLPFYSSPLPPFRRSTLDELTTRYSFRVGNEATANARQSGKPRSGSGRPAGSGCRTAEIANVVRRAPVPTADRER